MIARGIEFADRHTLGRILFTTMQFFADKECTNDNYFIIRMFKPDDSSKVKYAPTFKKQKGVAEGTYKKQLHAYVRLSLIHI